MTSRPGPASELDQVIFGGTFDPPHVGHLAVIRGLRALTGQLIVVMPSGIPGHRPAPTASAEDRADLVELAVAALGDPRVRVCRHEAEREEPSFTVDTVEWWLDRSPRDRLTLALGSDTALGLSGWKSAQRLLDLVGILVFDRPGAAVSAASALHSLASQGLRVSQAERIEISTPEVDASRIRERLRRGEACTDALAPGTGDYIRTKGIYRSLGGTTAQPGAG